MLNGILNRIKEKYKNFFIQLQLHPKIKTAFDEIIKFILNGFLFNCLFYTFFKMPFGIFEIIGLGALYHYLIEYPLFIVQLKNYNTPEKKK